MLVRGNIFSVVYPKTQLTSPLKATKIRLSLHLSSAIIHSILRVDIAFNNINHQSYCKLLFILPCARAIDSLLTLSIIVRVTRHILHHVCQHIVLTHRLRSWVVLDVHCYVTVFGQFSSCNNSVIILSARSSTRLTLALVSLLSKAPVKSKERIVLEIIGNVEYS